MTLYYIWGLLSWTLRGADDDPLDALGVHKI